MQLNTAKKCVKRVPPAKSRIIRPMFNVVSLNFARMSMPTKSTARPNITSSATSGRSQSKFWKTGENAASDGFESNSRGTAFCLRQPVDEVLVLVASGCEIVPLTSSPSTTRISLNIWRCSFLSRMTNEPQQLALLLRKRLTSIKHIQHGHRNHDTRSWWDLAIRYAVQSIIR